MHEDDPTPADTSRGPAWLPTSLIVVATILAVVSTMATWVHSQALDTDQWVEVSNDLLDEPEVQRALSAYLADELFATVDVSSELESLLPENLTGLAGPIAGALRGPATDGIERLISSDRFATVWENANRRAHETAVAILRGESRRNVSTASGSVVLDLGDAVRHVGEQLGVPGTAIDRIPADAGQIVIFQSDDLAQAQDAVTLLDFVSWFTFVLVVALYAIAVYLAVGRRRRMLRSVGIGVTLAGIALLAIRSVGVRTSIDLFVDDSSRESLANLVGSVMTELLREMAWTGVVYGLLIIAFAELLGEHRWAIAFRREVAGATDSIPKLVAVGLAILVVLVWWSPGHAFDRWVTSLTLVALVAGGVVALSISGRREALGETETEALEPAAVDDR